jgi:proline iminopeptidase
MFMRPALLWFISVVLFGTQLSAQDLREGYLPGASGLRLFYRVVGVGTPIIVIHGGPGADMGVLRDLEPLAANHRLIFYDQRGGGRSDLPEDTSLLDAKYFVEDLEAVRQFFKLEKVSLLAHSFGPVLAARYAEVYPQRIQRLIFMGAIGPRRSDATAFSQEVARRLPAPSLDRMKILVPLFQAGDNVDRVAICREYEGLAKTALPSGISPGLSMCDAPPAAVDYSLRYTTRLTFQSFGDWDYTKSLLVLNAPLLVIYGDQDPSPLSAQGAWTKAVGDGRLLIIGGAGHNPHSDRPQEVFKVISTFMEGKWPLEATRP